MNKFNKIILAAFGGVDTAFNLVSPLLIALLLINQTMLNPTNQFFILGIAIIASGYRALKFLVK